MRKWRRFHWIWKKTVQGQKSTLFSLSVYFFFCLSVCFSFLFLSVSPISSWPGLEWKQSQWSLWRGRRVEKRKEKNPKKIEENWADEIKRICFSTTKLKKKLGHFAFNHYLLDIQNSKLNCHNYKMKCLFNNVQTLLW